MQLYEVIWKDRYVEKIERKHEITTDEVEQVLFSSPTVRRIEKGKVQGENLYAAYGQTDAGQYLIIFFIYKPVNAAMPISARNMTVAERRYYARQ